MHDVFGLLGDGAILTPQLSATLTPQLSALLEGVHQESSSPRASDAPAAASSVPPSPSLGQVAAVAAAVVSRCEMHVI